MKTVFLPLGATSAMVVALFAGGCNPFTQTAGYLGRSQFTASSDEHNGILGFDSNRRAAYLTLDDKGRILGICSEPPPDTAATLALSANVNASGQATAVGGATGQGTFSVNGSMSQNVTELAKITSDTLFLREVLFRRCEAKMARHSGSGGDPALESQKDAADDTFFKDVMKSYVSLASARAASAQASVAPAGSAAVAPPSPPGSTPPPSGPPPSGKTPAPPPPLKTSEN
jgi:hypothetical protein